MAVITRKGHKKDKKDTPAPTQAGASTGVARLKKARKQKK